MRSTRRAACPAALALALLLATPANAAAGDPVGLGTAGPFAVLAGAGITNTGPTTITGDVGTFPTTSRTGFGSVTLTGTDHGGDAVTQGAKDALVTAYDDAAGRTPATPRAVELGGALLPAGVYTSPTFGLTGTLTLDAAGVPGAQFVFQAGSTLITEANSRVLLLNGANPCNVAWQVGSSATFKTGTRFAGDVLAYTSITAQTGATFRGRLLARNGAVTLDTNTISNATCNDTATPAATASPSASGASSTTSPTPAASATSTTSTTGLTSRDAPATPAAPRVPRESAGGPPVRPSLPATGLRGELALAGLVLLALGWALLAVGAPGRGRHAHGRPAVR
jgi:hypothetical protein